MWRLWIFFFLCVGAVRAATYTATCSYQGAGGSAAIELNEETGAYRITYNLNPYNDFTAGHRASAAVGLSSNANSFIDLWSKFDSSEAQSGHTTGFFASAGTFYLNAWAWDWNGSSGTHKSVQSISFAVGGKLTCQPGNRTTTGNLNSAILGTATGSKNGGAYNLSILSGPGVAAIDSSTGEWTIIPSGTGYIQAKFWISGSGIWARSDDVVVGFTIQPESEKKNVTVSLPSNGGTAPITYNVMQGGKCIGSFTQEGGAGAKIFQVGVDVNGGPVTMVQTTSGMVKDGVSLVQTGDGSGSISKPNRLVDNPSNLTDGATFIVDSDGKITDSSTGKVVDQTTPTKTPEKNTSPVVWSAGGGSQTDLVTNTVYREGVGKMVQALEDQTKKILGAEPEKLPDAVAPQFEEVAAHPTSSDMVSAVEGLLPAAPQFPTSIDRNPELELNLGDMGGVFPRPLSFKLGFPASARTAAGWLRNIELYGLYVVFFLICVRLIRKTFA